MTWRIVHVLKILNINFISQSTSICCAFWRNARTSHFDMFFISSCEHSKKNVADSRFESQSNWTAERWKTFNVFRTITRCLIRSESDGHDEEKSESVLDSFGQRAEQIQMNYISFAEVIWYMRSIWYRDKLIQMRYASDAVSSSLQEGIAYGLCYELICTSETMPPNNLSICFRGIKTSVRTGIYSTVILTNHFSRVVFASP